MAALNLLANLPGKRKIAVLGEMRELGGESVRLHELIGHRVAEVATHFVGVGPGGDIIAAAASGRGLRSDQAFTVRSARDALQHVAAIVREDAPLAEVADGDVVLVKGSRFTHMERVSLGLEGASVRCRLEVCHLYTSCNNCPQLEVDGDGPSQEAAARRAIHLRVQQ